MFDTVFTNAIYPMLTELHQVPTPDTLLLEVNLNLCLPLKRSFLFRSSDKNCVSISVISYASYPSMTWSQIILGEK
jgi:hypothetical protein